MDETYPYVSVEDLRSAAYGVTIPPGVDESLARLIEKAGERLAAHVPSIQTRIRSGKLSANLVAGVVEDIVLRVVKNPRGFSSEQAGDFSYRIDRAVASGSIEVTDADLALLAPRRPKVGSMRVGLPGWRVP